MKVNKRVRLDSEGDLAFANVSKSDEGAYVCMAKNVVGERKSPPAIVMVLGG